MAERVSVGEMASAIMESLEEYADLATEDLKKAVKSAGNTVKKGDSGERAEADGGLWEKLGGEGFQGDFQFFGGHSVFPEPVLAGAPAGIWPRQKGRRQGGREGAYRTGGGCGH